MGSVFSCHINPTSHSSQTACQRLVSVPQYHGVGSTPYVGMARGENGHRKTCTKSYVCEAYVIPFLFGLVCHPYIIAHFVEMFFCDLYQQECNPVLLSDMYIGKDLSRDQ